MTGPQNLFNGHQVWTPNLDFAPKIGQLEDFVAAKPSSARPQAMVHTPIVGACTDCRLAGSIDLPSDFDFRTADRLANGKIVGVYCPKCRRVTEFRALTPEELSEEQFFIMRRYYDVYKQMVVDGQALPAHVREFLAAYERRMQAKSAPPPPAPGNTKGGGP